jgi:DNA polymerase III epsilon subunit-like protein
MDIDDPQDDFISFPEQEITKPVLIGTTAKPPIVPVILPPWAKRILAFDLETTGTDADARIIEFGAVLFVDGQAAGFWECYVNPGNIDYSAPRVVEALGVSGIDLGRLASAMPFSQALHIIQSAFGQSQVRVAHHSRFDTGIIRGEIDRLKADPAINIEDYPPKGPYKSGTVLDTMALDIVLNPDARGRGLAPVAERWDIGGWTKHRAKGDADAAGRILLAMAPKLPPDLEDVLASMRQAQVKHDEIVAARRAEAASKAGSEK